MTGRQLALLIRQRKLSAREVMKAYLGRIDRFNPRLNAIVARLDNLQCLALAERADDLLARDEAPGPLHGLPIAFKDLESAVGFPFTRGSLIYRDFMASEDTVLVERLRRSGVLPIGKTNVPEFGKGSHTYNQVYGTTRNPYDLTKSAGGSSGGAGAALAAGMLPFADGSDFGGSLRNPANFNNIVALRPTVGLVPAAPYEMPFLGYSVKGPMARSVEDTAFLLSVMAGADVRDPLCYPSDPTIFAGPLERSWKGVRVAWCPDLGGLPVDRRVRTVLEARRSVFEDLGCIVEDACPLGLEEAGEIFLTIRKWRSWNSCGPLLEKYRNLMKPETIWETEEGSRVSSDDLARAMVGQAGLMERMRKFQQVYPFLVCAVNQVPPFNATLDWPHEIEGVRMEHYVAWMASAYWISTTFCPAISVPAGFTPEALPVGIQIVGSYRDDLGVLQLGYGFEQATGYGLTRPTLV
jgi:amidase